jgi:hypothetical protein
MMAPAWRQAMALTVAGLGTLAFGLELPSAAAQDLAPAKHSARRLASGVEKGPAIPKGSIRIKNSDSSTLLSVSLASKGDDPDVVAQSVPSGRSVIVPLPKAGECVYDIEGKFEDWSSVSVPGVDLCKDQTLNIGEPPPAAASEPSTPAKVPASVPSTSVKTTVAAPSASAKTMAARRPSGEEKQPVASNGRIRIENHRRSTLLTLLLTVRGETPHLVAQLVEGGASVVVGLPEAGKCVYDVQGEFADNYGTSLPGFDLCKEPTLKFSE